MANFADLRSRFAAQRTVAELIALAVFASIVFVTVGAGARRRAVAMQSQQSALQNAANELGAFHAAFRAGSPEEAVRMSVPDSLAVSIPHDLRVNLAERIATLAEESQLSDVRVWFNAGADSAAAPPRPDLMRAPVNLAGYTLSVQCTGSYASLLALVRQLPPSVALEHLTASGVSDAAGAPDASAGKAQFHLSLAIFEAEPVETESPATKTTNAAQHG